MKRKKILRTEFSLNIVSDKELLEQMEMLIEANCIINKHGKVEYYHKKSEYYQKLKNEMLERMNAASKNTHRNFHDTPKDER